MRQKRGVVPVVPIGNFDLFLSVWEVFLRQKRGVVVPVVPIGYFYLFSIFFGVDRTWPPLTGLLFIAFLRRSVKDG